MKKFSIILLTISSLTAFAGGGWTQPKNTGYFKLGQYVLRSDRYFNPEGEVTIGVVGKYVGLPDAYKSLNEALIHGGLANRVKVNIKWIDAEIFEGEESEIASALEPMHGILVPGGFGERGSEGKIASVRFARERDVPFFGICLGMQMACIEGARAAGIENASSTEFGETEEPVVGSIEEWMSDEGLQTRASDGDLGGTMRLGAYDAKLVGNSHTASIYGGAETISERHRHRYEFNNAYRNLLLETGYVVSGTSPDGRLVEIVELPDHPFFLASQFHPEFQSRPNAPHPLFLGMIKAAAKRAGNPVPAVEESMSDAVQKKVLSESIADPVA